MSKNLDKLNCNIDLDIFKIDNHILEEPDTENLIKNHIDNIVEKTINIKYKDEEMIILQNIIKELNDKFNKEKNKNDLLKQKLTYDINKIDEKLKNMKDLNDYSTEYRKIRLKAIKTKCKEILKWLN